MKNIFFFSKWKIHSTFVCPTEILAFSDRIHEFKDMNTEVIACSVDSHFTHLAWINTPRKEASFVDNLLQLSYQKKNHMFLHMVVYYFD